MPHKVFKWTSFSSGFPLGNRKSFAENWICFQKASEPLIKGMKNSHIDPMTKSTRRYESLIMNPIMYDWIRDDSRPSGLAWFRICFYEPWNNSSESQAFIVRFKFQMTCLTSKKCWLGWRRTGSSIWSWISSCTAFWPWPPHSSSTRPSSSLASNRKKPTRN